MSASHPEFVDIIIPTYNRARSIGAAIDSVLEQNHAHTRVIVVDDASTDGTDRLLRSYSSPRVTVRRADRNLGVTGAKNLGLQHLAADSTFFGILDSDDVLFKDAISTLMAGFSGGDFSQVLGRCVNAETGNVVSILDGQICESESELDFHDAMQGRLAGEYWHLARSTMVRDLRFDSRARGGEGLLWHGLLRLKPGLLLPHDVRMYSTVGLDRVSLGQYDRRVAEGKMWAYRCYAEQFASDLPHERYNEIVGEAIKYALFAGRFGYGMRELRTLDASNARKLKTMVWPLYASLRSWRANRDAHRQEKV